MNDPWKFLAFPAAALAGYLIAQTTLSAAIQDAFGVSQIIAESAVVALTGLAAGFLVDEMIPAYLEERKGGSGVGGADIGGDADLDID